MYIQIIIGPISGTNYQPVLKLYATISLRFTDFQFIDPLNSSTGYKGSDTK